MTNWQSILFWLVLCLLVAMPGAFAAGFRKGFWQRTGHPLPLHLWRWLYPSGVEIPKGHQQFCCWCWTLEYHPVCNVIDVGEPGGASKWMPINKLEAHLRRNSRPCANTLPCCRAPDGWKYHSSLLLVPGAHESNRYLARLMGRVHGY